MPKPVIRHEFRLSGRGNLYEFFRLANGMPSVFLVKLLEECGYNDHPIYFVASAPAGLLAGNQRGDSLFRSRARPILNSGFISRLWNKAWKPAE